MMFSHRVMIPGPPMMDKVASLGIAMGQKGNADLTKIAVFMGVGSCWAWKDNLFLGFTVDDQDNGMIYLQEYREEIATCIIGMEQGYRLWRQTAVSYVTGTLRGY